MFSNCKVVELFNPSDSYPQTDNHSIIDLPHVKVKNCNMYRGWTK